MALADFALVVVAAVDGWRSEDEDDELVCAVMDVDVITLDFSVPDELVFDFEGQ